MLKKICYGCKKELPLDNFNKNKNTKDGLSYYCRKCTKKKYHLHRYKNNKDNSEYVVIEELKKHNIQIEGFDVDKIKNLRIRLYDFPGAIRPLMKDLPIFLKKYSLTYEEYCFIIDSCHNNKFFIEPKDLNINKN